MVAEGVAACYGKLAQANQLRLMAELWCFDVASEAEGRAQTLETERPTVVTREPRDLDRCRRSTPFRRTS